jgi:NADH:ubiquinone oxidoreductase subunit E
MNNKFNYINSLKNEKTFLIKGLQKIQKKEGFISDEAIRVCAAYFNQPVVDVEGVVSFYAQFKRTAPGKYHLTVCDGTACHIKGSTMILDWISEELGIKDGEVTADGKFSIETVACLGCCSLAPVIGINGKVYGKLDRKSTLKLLKDFSKRD